MLRSVALPRSSMLLAAVLGVLVVAQALGLLYAKGQVDRRDGSIAELAAASADLQNAKSALQDDVRRLSQERQALLTTQESLGGQLTAMTAQRDQVQADRDRLQTSRDQLQVERDALAGRVKELEKRAADLETSLAESARQANLARQQAASKPAPTPAPAFDETKRAAVARVLDLDDQIDAEFNVFLGRLDTAVNSINRGDFLGAQAGYNRANQSAERLKDLFARRRAAAAPLR